MNPIMQTLLSSRLGPIKQMMGMVQAAQNPALALQQMAGNKPQKSEGSRTCTANNFCCRDCCQNEKNCDYAKILIDLLSSGSGVRVPDGSPGEKSQEILSF